VARCLRDRRQGAARRHARPRGCSRA